MIAAGTNLGRLVGREITGLSTINVSDEYRDEDGEIQLSLSDGSELLIVGAQYVGIKEPVNCPRCGKPFDA